jgi:hypothetical protein
LYLNGVAQEPRRGVDSGGVRSKQVRSKKKITTTRASHSEEAGRRRGFGALQLEADVALRMKP